MRERREERPPRRTASPADGRRGGETLAPRWTAGLALAACLAAVFTSALPPVVSADETPSQALLATADQVLKEMSRITGLAIRAPLKKQLVSRPDVRKFMMEKIHEDYTPEEMHVQEATLKAFGFVSSDFDLEKFLVAFYTEQAAGFYDPGRKTMYIADWPPPEMQSLVLAHELTHALQDQNFDLDRFLRAERANDDATAAREAVAEGHATAAMVQKMVEPADLASLPSLEPIMAGLVQQQMADYPEFSNAPYFFKLQALFPYSEGMGFVQRGLALGGWKRLNAVFNAPPETTKEMFEPSVYFNSVTLPGVKLPRPSALERSPGLKRLTENTLGELGYRALLGQFISDAEAKSIGSQWMDDRYILYERSSPLAFTIVARTKWSSAEPALAFFRDYHTVLARKYPELTADQRSATDVFVGSAANGAVVLVRRRDECLWAEGVPASATDSVLKWLNDLAPTAADPQERL